MSGRHVCCKPELDSLGSGGDTSCHLCRIAAVQARSPGSVCFDEHPLSTVDETDVDDARSRKLERLKYSLRKVRGLIVVAGSFVHANGSDDRVERECSRFGMQPDNVRNQHFRIVSETAALERKLGGGPVHRGTELLRHHGLHEEREVCGRHRRKTLNTNPSLDHEIGSGSENAVIWTDQREVELLRDDETERIVPVETNSGAVQVARWVPKSIQTLNVAPCAAPCIRDGVSLSVGLRWYHKDERI